VSFDLDAVWEFLMAESNKCRSMSGLETLSEDARSKHAEQGRRFAEAAAIVNRVSAVAELLGRAGLEETTITVRRDMRSDYGGVKVVVTVTGPTLQAAVETLSKQLKAQD
jgi:hypothetical protein